MKTRPGLLLPALVAAAASLTFLIGGCTKAPEASATPPAASAAAANIADADVSTNVTTALQRSETLKGFDIKVVTTKGDVRLTGVLDSRAQIDEAIRIARAADGAHAVHDELTIRK